MKQLIIVLTLYISTFSIQVKAQKDTSVAFDVRNLNTTYNALLARYNIDSLLIMYENNKPKYLEVHVKDPKIPRLVEYYSLTFEGHQYLLKKKYPQFMIPLPTLSMTYLEGVKNVANLKGSYSLYTTVKPDSVIQAFSYHTNNRDANSGPPQPRPLLKRNLSELNQIFQKQMERIKSLKVTDSVIILEGTVEKNGSLTNLKVKSGKSSPYLEKVTAFFQLEATDWLPRINQGTKRQSPVEIAVRANADKTFKISIW